jgi:putative addiction module component (TIGR02574 family)
MTKSTQSLLEGVLHLPHAERAEVAEELLHSLDDAERSRLESLWYAEARRRFDAHRRGEMGATPADQVLASLERKA